MSNSRSVDEMLVQRHADGELNGAARDRLQARLLVEPELQRMLEEAEGTRALFRRSAAGAPDPLPTPGFAERVLQRARRLPTGEELEDLESAVRAGDLLFARRLLVAALVLVGALVAFGAGLITVAEPDSLEATPDEISAQIRELDEAIVQEQRAEEREGRGR